MMSATLGQVVGDVGSWNPQREARGQHIDYIDLSSIDNERKTIKSHQRVHADEAPSRARQLVCAGDILLSTVRPNLNGVARVPRSLGGATASTGFCVLRADTKKVSPEYLFQWLRTPLFIADMTKKATGASYPAVSDRIVWESEIPLPPLGEQRRIAAILDQVDDLRGKRERALDLLETLPSSAFIKTFGDPVTNSRQFARCKLGDIVDFVGGSQPPKLTFSYEDGPDKVRLVQIRDFKSDRYKTYVPKELAKRPFAQDDVMIARYGPPVFQILRGLAGTYNVALMKAAPKQGITKDFIYYLLQEKALHGHVVANSERTAGQSGVNLDLLENYPAYLPPKDLLNDFSNSLSRVQLIAARQRQQLKRLKELFAAMQASFFGSHDARPLTIAAE